MAGSVGRFGGIWTFRHFSKRGYLRWLKRLPNMTTLAGLNYLIDAALKTPGNAVGSWYIGLINNATFVALSADDTMLSHSGWTEFTSYNESTRPLWTPGSVSGGALASSFSTAFTITGAGTLTGGFVVSESTKGGTNGTLLATGAFEEPRLLEVGETFTAEYTFTGTGN